MLDYLLERQGQGEVVTGLLYLDESVGDLHETNNTAETPLARLPENKLRPTREQLAKVMREL